MAYPSYYVMLFSLSFPMDCIIWNVRGTGNQAPIARVKHLVSRHSLSYFYLLEPLVDPSKQADTGRRLGFHSFFYNNNGNFWFFLETTTSFLPCFIYGSITLSRGNNILCSFTYAKCTYLEKHFLWTYLLSTSHNILAPWMVGRDFNVALNPSECSSTTPLLHPNSDFASMISNCGLCDPPLIGIIFTWCRSTSPSILK